MRLVLAVLPVLVVVLLMLLLRDAVLIAFKENDVDG